MPADAADIVRINLSIEAHETDAKMQVVSVGGTNGARSREPEEAGAGVTGTIPD